MRPQARITARCRRAGSLGSSFWALGAIDVRSAVAATVVVLALLGVWLVGVLYRTRKQGRETASRAQRDRERRGF